MLGDVLDVICLIVDPVALFFLVRGPVRRGYGFLALAAGFGAAGTALHRDQFGASLMAGVCAVATWAWRNKGGGDGTRRRLRALARAFRGVRRTAPVTGGAS